MSSKRRKVLNENSRLTFRRSGLPCRQRTYLPSFVFDPALKQETQTARKPVQSQNLKAKEPEISHAISLTTEEFVGMLCTNCNHSTSSSCSMPSAFSATENDILIVGELEKRSRKQLLNYSEVTEKDILCLERLSEVIYLHNANVEDVTEMVDKNVGTFFASSTTVHTDTQTQATFTSVSTKVHDFVNGLTDAQSLQVASLCHMYLAAQFSVLTAEATKEMVESEIALTQHT